VCRYRAAFKSVTAFVVPLAEPGISVEPVPDLMGLTTASIAGSICPPSVCLVPRFSAELGEGAFIMAESLNWERTILMAGR
jgi:alkylation response protein AidB-like acyl-CoA dehydrogenase